MGAIVSLLLGGMIGRVAGPIAQDYFENETKIGRRIMSRKEERDIRKEERNLEQKLKISEAEHQRRISEMRIQNEARRKDAESLYFRACTDANMRTFLRDCWPLRNPFDSPLAIEPIYQETSQMLEGCKLKTIISPNKMEIVPLRFISALKDNAHPEAASINCELSMFLVNNYSSNGEHAVVSEIGAWREDIPVNDASINYLFKGMKGQPVMVFVPEFQHNGNVVRFKIWSWGLGESLTYPVGFDFGWLDLTGLYNRLLASENRKLANTLKKVDLPPSSEAIKKNEKIISLLSEKSGKLSNNEKEYLLSMLDTPFEINVAVRKRFTQVVSEVFSIVAAMYSDGYHLMEYGTKPMLPTLITAYRDIPFMLPYLTSFYQTITNSALSKAIISLKDALDIELTLAGNLRLAYPNSEESSELIDHIRMLNGNTEGDLHKATILRLREINNIQKQLRQ